MPPRLHNNANIHSCARSRSSVIKRTQLRDHAHGRTHTHTHTHTHTRARKRKRKRLLSVVRPKMRHPKIEFSSNGTLYFLFFIIIIIIICSPYCLINVLWGPEIHQRWTHTHTRPCTHVRQPLFAVLLAFSYSESALKCNRRFPSCISPVFQSES